MFDIAFSELLIAALAALIVLGPDRLPRLARQAGEWLGKIQRYVNDVKSDVGRQMELEELRRVQAEVAEAAQSLKESVEQTAGETQKELESFNEAAGAELPSVAPTDWDNVYAVRRARERIRERRAEREAELGRKRRKLPQRQARV